MRRARVADIWRSLGKRVPAAGPIVEQFEIKNLSGFKDVSFEAKSGFLCICGGTGHGKTALLKAFERSLAGGFAEGVLPERVSAAEISARVKYGSEEYELDGNDSSYPIQVRPIDLWERTSKLISYFRENDIAVLKEGLSPIEFPENIISDISACCGKGYQSITAYEVEGEGDDILPWFEVSEGGRNYNSLDAATGELSVFYLAWALHYSARGAFLLIEEPEAYLPPRAHEYVVSMLASAAEKRGLGVVISTHSAEVVAAIPDPQIAPLRREGGHTTLAKGPDSKIRALARLGLGPKQHLIAVVEDESAKCILTEILSDDRLRLELTFDITIDRDGAGSIKKFASRIPNELGITKIIGVLDGDQKIEEKEKGYPLLLLPIPGAPEAELLRNINASVGRLSGLINRSQDRVEDLFEEFGSLDPHDALLAVAKDLRIGVDDLIRKLFAIWEQDQENQKLVQTFKAEILKRIKE